MDNIFEKISLTLILLKIFDIYFFCYLATNEEIAITHLWQAIEPQTMYHLIAKNKVAEQHIFKRKIIADGRNAQPASGLTVTIRVRIISKWKAGSQSKPKKQLYPETRT